MCNLAGYIGKEPAAPILIDMLARQEGFAGGYYSGIATIYENRLYYRKVIGDVATLVRETDAEDLPGSVGIIHSRSKDGGGAEWGHPFISSTENMAYVANGSEGIFSKYRDKDEIAQRLATSGHKFRSQSYEPIGAYPVLKDGSSVHSSEVMCRLIESYIAQGSNPPEAMQNAFCEFPSDVVGLMLHENLADNIIVTRINRPLMIGFKSDAMYIATTAMAFPNTKDFSWVNPLPINSTAVIGRKNVQISPLGLSAKLIIPFIPWRKGYDRIIKLLGDKRAHSFNDCVKATTSLWPNDVVSQKDMMVYEILRDLSNHNLIQFKDELVPSVLPNVFTNKKRVYLNNT